MKVEMLRTWDSQLFELTESRAVALIFSDAQPPGLPRGPISQPSGCTFWKLAADGNVFYTEARDHFGCPVGAYTLGAHLPEDQDLELKGLVSTMVKLSYVTEHEISELPRRATPLGCIIYAPLGLSPAFPDLVLVRGNARQLMLLTEAARSANCLKDSPAMGRPACTMLPESLTSNQVVLSLGCVGNRVYTGLADQEGYIAIPGNALELVCSELSTIVQANDALALFHHERLMRCAATA